MQLTTIVLPFLIVYGVSCFRIEKTSHVPQPNQIRSASEFYGKLDELFEAFNQNDTEQMEDIFNALKSNNLNEVEELLMDTNSINNYARRFHDYVPNRISKTGYPVEDHTVVTDDGYILHVFRIPYGLKSPQTNRTRPPVLLMHGLMDSSNGYINLGPEYALAYILADAGYDVWLGNARGTAPSRTHVHLKPNGIRQKKYWSFSWHEIGVVDLPAVIDHILFKTNQKKLAAYVGHSQGTTAFLVMTSMRPEYNDKLMDVHLMAPVSKLTNIRNRLFTTLAKYYKPLKRLFEVMRIYKLDGNKFWPWKAFELAYRSDRPYDLDSSKLISRTFFNTEVMRLSLGYVLGGASVSQFVHYGQMIIYGDFSLFDYENAQMNRKMYGRDTPPPYNLTAITAPVNLYYSKNDDTATFENAKELESQLQNLKSSYFIQIEDFDHVDFIMSTSAKDILYNRILHSIDKCNGKL